MNIVPKGTNECCLIHCSPVSPLKLSYSARKRSNNDSTSVGKSEFSRARSFTSLQACETSLAVQSERDSRRVIEKSSAFDYWWDDNNNPVQSKKCNGKTNRKVDANLFSTYPPKHASKAKQKRGQLKDGNLCVEKSYSVDDVLEKSLRAGDSLAKGDLQL